MHNTDVTIVGAGPIGSYLSYLLSRDGISNALIEEHTSIGKPEQCAGLISRNIDEMIPKGWMKNAVLNKVNGAVISCGKESFEIRAKEYKAYVFDRSLFDRNLVQKAEKSGSRLFLGHEYTSHQQDDNGNKSLKIRLDFRKKEQYIQSKVLVGADGPCSKVAFNSSLFGERRFFIGKQVLAKIKKPFFEKDMVYVYLDKIYSDGFFAWVVPVNESTAKIGLASLTRPAEHFERFIREKIGKHEVIEDQGGLIPFYKKINLQNKEKNIFLVGDAALQCKATSGGGVVNGMLSAKELFNAIKSRDFEYEKRLKDIRKNLWFHLMIRKKLNSMNDQSMEGLLKKLNDKNIKDVLERYGDMDFPKRFIFRMISSKPSLLRYLL